MQQGIAVFLPIQLKATRSEDHSCPRNAYISDSGPALEHPSNALSSNTALERALPSFSLCLMMETNDSMVTAASLHLSSFSKASNLKPYSQTIFTQQSYSLVPRLSRGRRKREPGTHRLCHALNYFKFLSLFVSSTIAHSYVT